MRGWTIGRSGKILGMLLGLFLVLFIFCGCSGGGGGGGSGNGQTDGATQLIDISVSVSWLDRVYDDDELYYAIDVATGDVQSTVSETDSWTPSEYFNGVWSSTNTWKFDTTIEVPVASGDFYFLLYKMMAGEEADAWESDSFSLQADQTEYSMELYPEFSEMNYHIQGVVILTGAGLQDVNVTLSGDNNTIQQTGAGGLFSFADIPNGDYVVTPRKDGFQFEPEFKAVTIENASVLTIYFAAESE